MHYYNNFLKPRIVCCYHVLQGGELPLDKVVPQDLVSSSNLVVSLVYKNRRPENSLQIFPVGQMEVPLKGVWICKGRHVHISNRTVQIMMAKKIIPLLLSILHLVPPPLSGKEGHRATPQT